MLVDFPSVDVNVTDKEYNLTPLLWATHYGELQVIDFLLQNSKVQVRGGGIRTMPSDTVLQRSTHATQPDLLSPQLKPPTIVSFCGKIDPRTAPYHESRQSVKRFQLQTAFRENVYLRHRALLPVTRLQFRSLRSMFTQNYYPDLNICTYPT